MKGSIDSPRGSYVQEIWVSITWKGRKGKEQVRHLSQLRGAISSGWGFACIISKPNLFTVEVINRQRSGLSTSALIWI